MEVSLKVFDSKAGVYLEGGDCAMNLAGLDPRLGFEAFGVQDDGTPVVFDRCGNFGYLDSDRYKVELVLE